MFFLTSKENKHYIYNKIPFSPTNLHPKLAQSDNTPQGEGALRRRHPGRRGFREKHPGEVGPGKVGPRGGGSREKGPGEEAP